MKLLNFSRHLTPLEKALEYPPLISALFRHWPSTMTSLHHKIIHSFPPYPCLFNGIYHFWYWLFLYLLLCTAIDILRKKSSPQKCNFLCDKVGTLLVLLYVREFCKPRCLKIICRINELTQSYFTNLYYLVLITFEAVRNIIQCNR